MIAIDAVAKAEVTVELFVAVAVHIAVAKGNNVTNY